MNSFALKVSQKDAQYGRFVSALLRTLKGAVGDRVEAGCTQRQIAERLEWHPSQLSRVLNGRVSNLTARTISDILWACAYEPVEFDAHPVEAVSDNCVVSFFTPSLSHQGTSLSNNVMLFALHPQATVPGSTGKIWSAPAGMCQ